MTAPEWPDTVTVHPAAELFPMMPGDRFEELVEDVRANGLMESIVVTPDGAVLDGRHRLLACQSASVEPRFTTHKGDPWRFVISVNLHRRHLTDVQRAVIASKIADRSRGERKSNASAEAFEAPPQTEAAHLLNVSRTAVQRARAVLQHGTPAVAALVEEGKVPLATAHRVARTLPAAEQDEFARKVSAGMLPRGAAPPEERPSEPRRKRPPKPPSSDTVISATALTTIASDMTGIDLALKSITDLDPALSRADLEHLERAFTKGIRGLTRIRRLMRRAAEGEQQP